MIFISPQQQETRRTMVDHILEIKEEEGDRILIINLKEVGNNRWAKREFIDGKWSEFSPEFDNLAALTLQNKASFIWKRKAMEQ